MNVPKTKIIKTEDPTEANELDNIDELGASTRNNPVESEMLNQPAMQNIAGPEEIPNLLEHLNIRFPEIINDDYSYGEDAVVSEYMQMFLQNVLDVDSSTNPEHQVSDAPSCSSTLDQNFSYSESNRLDNVSTTLKNPGKDQEGYVTIENTKREQCAEHSKDVSKIITDDISKDGVYEDKQKMIPMDNTKKKQLPRSKIKKDLAVTPEKELYPSSSKKIKKDEAKFEKKKKKKG